MSEQMPGKQKTKQRPPQIWRPGQTGNPKGRPRIERGVKDLCKTHTVEAVNTIIGIMRDGETPSVRLAAAKMLLDRAWGLPAGSMEGAQLNIDARQVHIHQMAPAAEELVNRALAMLGGQPLLEGAVIELEQGQDEQGGDSGSSDAPE